MRYPDDRLITPLYLKLDDELETPEDERVFYVLSRSGLFLHRNHPFFTSCVRAPTCPSELAAHQEKLELRYPKMPQSQIERIIGFFSRIAELYRAEAAVLLLWDRQEGRLRTHVPRQQARVTEGWGGHLYPFDVKYDMPGHLAPHLSVVGTVHSHVDGAAYASATDCRDEQQMTGLHVVVGHIFGEPPQFHCEFVVDGTRFPVRLSDVVERYERRREQVPRKWIDRVEVLVERWDRRKGRYVARRITGTAARGMGTADDEIRETAR
jgi:proteasome lid subunit RPN8/RPN11